MGSLSLVVTMFGAAYVGTDRVDAIAVASPTNGGGSTFEFPIELDLTMEVVLDPFQSLTFTQLSASAVPKVLVFPDFGGNIRMTIDRTDIDFLSGTSSANRKIDLNLKEGGIFEKLSRS